jgi:hypothetical protein
MKYYNTETSTVVSERQVVKANPNTSFALPFSDATLASLSLVRLTDDTKPAYDSATEIVIEDVIEVRDGVAYQTYSVIDRPAEAIANELINKKANVRIQRNDKLSRTDWAVLPDSPLSTDDKTVYENYRAALRDVPAQVGFPDNALPESPDEPPYGSWTYDSTAFVWNAPLPKPEGQARWDEIAYQEDSTTGWITIGI